MTRYFSGLRGIVKAAGESLAVTGWSITLQTELIETTNTGDDGRRSFVFGARQAVGRLAFHWDADANYLDVPPGLQDGQSVALELYLESPAGGVFSLPAALVHELEVRSEVDRVVSAQARFRSTGAFTVPAGAF